MACARRHLRGRGGRRAVGTDCSCLSQFAAGERQSLRNGVSELGWQPAAYMCRSRCSPTGRTAPSPGWPGDVSEPGHRPRGPPGCRAPARSAAQPPDQFGRRPGRPGDWPAARLTASAGGSDDDGFCLDARPSGFSVSGNPRLAAGWQLGGPVTAQSGVTADQLVSIQARIAGAGAGAGQRGGTDGGDGIVGRFRCVCATVIQMSGGIPNELEGKILSDIEFDSFQGLADAERLCVAARSMSGCPACGRLWVFWDGVDRPPQCYRPEDLHELGGHAGLESGVAAAASRRYAIG